MLMKLQKVITNLSWMLSSHTVLLLSLYKLLHCRQQTQFFQAHYVSKIGEFFPFPATVAKENVKLPPV